MSSPTPSSQAMLEDFARRLNYFSRQCWQQQRLYNRQSSTLRQRIAEQDAELRDAHARLVEANERLRDANNRLCETFSQLQDVTAARITAELKLAGYGLLDCHTAAHDQPTAQYRLAQQKSNLMPEEPSPFCSPSGFHAAWSTPAPGGETDNGVANDG